MLLIVCARARARVCVCVCVCVYYVVEFVFNINNCLLRVLSCHWIEIGPLFSRYVWVLLWLVLVPAWFLVIMIGLIWIEYVVRVYALFMLSFYSIFGNESIFFYFVYNHYKGVLYFRFSRKVYILGFLGISDSSIYIWFWSLVLVA